MRELLDIIQEEIRDGFDLKRLFLIQNEVFVKNLPCLNEFEDQFYPIYQMSRSKPSNDDNDNNNCDVYLSEKTKNELKNKLIKFVSSTSKVFTHGEEYVLMEKEKTFDHKFDITDRELTAVYTGIVYYHYARIQIWTEEEEEREKKLNIFFKSLASLLQVLLGCDGSKK